MGFVEKELTFKWVTNLSGIAKGEWDAIYDEDIFCSYAFFKAMNSADFENVSFLYLVIYDKKEIVCIVPCFTYLLDLYYILSSSSVKKAIKCVRKVCSGFFKLKTFIVGSYISTCEHHIGIAKNLPQYKVLAIKEIVNRELKKQSREEKASLTLIKEVRGKAIEAIKNFFDRDILFFEEYPKTIIPVNHSMESYPLSLRKKHRQTYRKYLAEFERTYEWMIVEDYESLIPTFYVLYQNVLRKSKIKFEVLNESYFRELKKNLSEQTFCLVAKDHQGEIRLIEILLEDKDKLVPFYLGIDYRNENTTMLYLNNIYRTVKEAEIRSKAIVELGQTAYYPKIMSGALAEKMFLGFYAYKRVWKFFIKYIFKYIFTPAEIYPNVYLEKYKETVKNHCAAAGYKIYN